jgi:mycofactocin precursor
MQEKKDEIKKDENDKLDDNDKLDENDKSNKIIQEIQIEELTIDGICGVY